VAAFAQDFVYDIWAYALDFSFGFAPSFLLKSLADISVPTVWFFFGIYSHLSLFMVIASGIAMTRGRADGVYFNPLVAFATSAIAGNIMYNLWPLVGPGVLFGSIYHGERFVPWTWPPPPTDFRLLPVEVEIGRNTMPSMHTTFCLLAALTMVRNRDWRIRWFAWIFLGATIISAAYVSHYLIDFVVALPLVLVNLGLASWRQLTTTSARCEAMLVGLATLILCYLGFIYWVDTLLKHPVVVAVSQVLIVLTFIIVERRLARSGTHS
jgi:hypothetical protein